MSLTRVLRAIGALSALFGVGFAFAPQAVLAPYGLALDPSGTFVARVLGAANIGLGVALWFGAGQESQTGRGLAWGVIAYSLVEAVATILAISAGVANSLAWGFVVLDAVFIAACSLSVRKGGLRVAEPSAATGH